MKLGSGCGFDVDRSDFACLTFFGGLIADDDATG